MAVKLQRRRGTAAAWTGTNPTLLAGEIGLETDTQKFKVGDGATAWNGLTYWGGGGGSVTSANFVSLRSDVGRISDVLSQAVSAIGVNSAQMTSADNAISAAAALVSSRLDSTNTVVSNQGSAIVANSAQMTSADNAISTVAADALSAARAASANITSVLSNQVSALRAADISIMSAVSVESAARAGADTSIDGRVTSVASIASAAASNIVSLASDVGRISTQVAAGLVSAGPVKRVLAGDQAVQVSAPVSLSGFTFTCSAGVGYGFEFGIFYSTPVSLAGPKFVMSFPSSSPAVIMYAMGGAVGGVSVQNFDRTNVTASCTSVSATGVPIATFVRGTFRCSANGGTAALAVANNVGSAGGSNITFLAGSYGYVWRMG